MSNKEKLCISKFGEQALETASTAIKDATHYVSDCIDKYMKKYKLDERITMLEKKLLGKKKTPKKVDKKTIAKNKIGNTMKKSTKTTAAKKKTTTAAKKKAKK